MSRRYAASERVRTWSDEYMCTVSIIPGRELVYHFDSLPSYRPKSKIVVIGTEKRLQLITDYIREHGEATVTEISDALDMTISIIRLTLLAHTDVFQVRNGRQKQGPVNLWSLRESAKK